MGVNNIDIHEPVVTYEDIKLEMKHFAFEQAEIAFSNNILFIIRINVQGLEEIL